MCRKRTRLPAKKKPSPPKRGFSRTASKATTAACSCAARSAIRENRPRGFKARPSREPTWLLFPHCSSTFTDSTITSRLCAFLSTAFFSTRGRALPKTCTALPRCMPSSSKSENSSTNSTRRAKSGSEKSKCIRLP